MEVKDDCNNSGQEIKSFTNLDKKQISAYLRLSARAFKILNGRKKYELRCVNVKMHLKLISKDT
jgi:hypothetical protein